jgi:hypothetical protein
MERRTKDPGRFSRPIDATFLDDQIDIICNPKLYKRYFKDALNAAFPQGDSEARIFLTRLIPPRNSLYHANPISVHDAYRVLCYALDVIEALKQHYSQANMAQQYNVPTVIRICDSLGHVVSPSNAPSGFSSVDYSNDQSAHLRCGDTISIEVDVDPAFDPKEYEIRWQVVKAGGPQMTGPKFSLLLTEPYVSTRFCVVCRVTSNKSWHKIGEFDDQIDIVYRVLPPI